MPRCITVGPKQGLRVVNATSAYGPHGAPITVRFIGFRKRVAPGQAAVFPRPFGNYLAPGDHLVISNPKFNGPEILLVGG